MADVVERRIDESLLELATLQLNEQERTSLDLPVVSAAVQLRIPSGSVAAQWQPRQRQLSGEAFAEYVQLYGQIGGLLRLSHDGDSVRLDVFENAAATRSISAATRPSRTPVIRQVADRSAEMARRQRQQRRAERRQDRFRLRTQDEYKWHGEIGLHRASLDTIAANMRGGGWDDRNLFQLRLEMEELSASNDFDELLAVDLAAIDHMAHQEGAARKVLGQLRGRAVLADEVGLGKTVEAGLILKELVLRGLARRILVLTPTTLREQWRDELKEKFSEDFQLVTASNRFDPDSTRVIMSVPLGVRLHDRLTTLPWDLVIVDEAHKFTGRGAVKTQNFLRALESRYLLFLTATPVQNDLVELYRLVDLLRPGTFQSEAEFRRQFCGSDRRTPVDPAGLRRLVADVMVRTTREQAGIDTVARHPVDVPITLDPAERAAYELCIDMLRHVMTDNDDRFRRRHLAHRLTTSPRALARSAARLAETHPNSAARARLRELADLSLDFGLTSRQRALIERTKAWTADPAKGKVIVFTQHTDTLEDLFRLLADEGIDAAVFHGGLAPSTRQQMIQQFRRDVPVLLSTDAGAEGLNLQFANCVINYDLPWNPMRIEQRIGRVHRVTQTRDVHVANFYARDTVDELVYRILHDKLRMFELLFGQVTTILGELDDDDGSTFEARILNAISAADDGSMQRRLAALGDKIAVAYDRTQESIHAGAHLGWMTDKRYRVDLPGPQATELMPQLERLERQRHRRAALLVRRAVEQLGGTIAHEDVLESVAGLTAVPEFLSVQFNPGLAGDLDLPEELHLAFTSDALQRHRDAELCAVGSEVFDDLADAVRDRGDLHAALLTQISPNEVPEVPHLHGLNRRDVQVIGPTEWAAACHWRVNTQHSNTGADFVTTFVGDQKLLDAAVQHQLHDGQMLPTSLPAADEVIGTTIDAAVTQLQPQLDETVQEQTKLFEQERERQLAAYRLRLAELATSAGTEALEQAERIRRAAERIQAGKPPSAQLTADLVSVELVAGGPVRIEEQWTAPNGATGTVGYTWDPAAGAPALTGHDGQPIALLGCCTDGHLVDASGLRSCASCSTVSCRACANVWETRLCSCCRLDACGRCCATPGAVCAVCSAPQREPALDRAGLRAWRLGDRGVLLVGPSSAIIERPDQAPRHTLQNAEPEAHSASLQRHLAANGFGLDAVIHFESCPQVEAEDTSLAADVYAELRWAARPADDQPTVATHQAAGALIERLAGDVPDIEVTLDPPAGLAGLLDQLRMSAPPTTMIASVVEHRIARWMQLTGRGLETRRLEASGSTPPVRSVENIGKWTALASSEAFAAAEVGAFRASARRLHRSYLIDIETPRGKTLRFVAGTPGAGFRDEATKAAVQRLLGLGEDATVSIIDVLGAAPRWTEAEAPAIGEPPATALDADLLFGLQEIDARQPGALPAFQIVDPAMLPADYVPNGLVVHAAVDHTGAAAYLLRGAVRGEALYVGPDQQTTWWSLHTPTDPASALAYPLARLTGIGDVEARWHTIVPRSPTADRLTLSERSQSIARLTQGERYLNVPLSDAADAALALINALGGPRPNALPAALQAIASRMLPAVPTSTPTPVDILVDEEVTRLHVTSAGLTRSHHDASGDTEHLEPWTTPSSTRSTLPGTWQVAPTVVAHSELEGWRAELLRLEELSWLSVGHNGDGASLYKLSGTADNALAAVLSRQLGQSGPVHVAAYSDPGSILPVTVRNAQPAGRQWRAVPHAVAPGQGSPEQSAAAARALGFAPPEFPKADDLPSSYAALRQGLLAAMGPTPAHHCVALGLDVTDIWTTPFGPVEVRYQLKPGAQEGMVVATDTRAPSAQVTVDRRQHLAAVPHTCLYCRELTCAACEDGVRPCRLCAIPLCGRCAAAQPGGTQQHPGLCPACRSLRRPGRLSRMLGRGGAMQSNDHLHQVAVERGRDGRLTLRVTSNGQPVAFEVKVGSDAHRICTEVFEHG